DDGLVLDREGDVGPADDRRAAQPEVVAIERDVQRPHGQRGAVDLGDAGGEPMREGDAAGAQADEREVRRAAVLLEDLVRDAGEGPVERRFVENLSLLSEARYRGGHLLSLRASRGSLKGKVSVKLSSLYTCESVAVKHTGRRGAGHDALSAVAAAHNAEKVERQKRERAQHQERPGPEHQAPDGLGVPEQTHVAEEVVPVVDEPLGE